MGTELQTIPCVTMHQEASDMNQYEMTQTDMLDTKLKRTEKYKKTEREIILEEDFHSYSLN